MTSSPTWAYDDDTDDDAYYADGASTNTFQGAGDDGDDDDDDDDTYYNQDDYWDNNNFWPTMSPTVSICPEADTPATFSFDGHAYYFNEREVTWGEHQACARQWEGSLSSIESEPEQQAIQNQIAAQLGDSMRTRVYIGQQKVNDAWKWADGTAVAYVNWATDEPMVNAQKKRVEMNFAANQEIGKWIAVKGSEWRMGIYKK
eukprot:CAMPEP_0194264842 /NCGR_PEP_ID=MMETSP0169-20130528/191_1 /TAXON_ID=218684 /ORGANISM="Corethron pennatum, Strain L29A3" /LENGTH=201 /DNA_ID=CAMNT_0039005139 /DNA_START=352 /DNA_END=957 /DNA_ORIENTATION=+